MRLNYDLEYWGSYWRDFLYKFICLHYDKNVKNKETK